MPRPMPGACNSDWITEAAKLMMQNLFSSQCRQTSTTKMHIQNIKWAFHGVNWHGLAYLCLIAAKIYFLEKGEGHGEQRLTWPLDKPIDRATVHQTERNENYWKCLGELKKTHFPFVSKNERRPHLGNILQRLRNADPTGDMANTRWRLLRTRLMQNWKIASRSPGMKKVGRN